MLNIIIPMLKKVALSYKSKRRKARPPPYSTVYGIFGERKTRKTNLVKAACIPGVSP